ncbi:cytochrome c3 family protein [Adlercreutzia sp. R25]|uniref:cytochrome c3 family protein n=1 Tax=Adlercreutzia shanghongiae TaxID=3111773 RepID=UPI002DBAC9F1|nr:cytochrome c3 family protein [Adlercreutzia sp. R25]MEC4272797.1 cytochrome c3 family protein [Adlercreutzia sp. R25]
MKAKKVTLMLATFALAVALGAVAACSPSGASDLAETGGSDWDAVVAANPDDPYVASYEAEDPATLITMHKKLGNTCESCHDEEIASMVGTFDELVGPSEDTLATREFCLNDGCHSWEKIVDSTILDGDKTVYNPEGLYNVHDNHRGDVDCGQCHSMHGQPTLNCVQCHYMDLPEGWDGFE